MNSSEEPRYIRIDVGGKSPKLWIKFRSKLIKTVDKLLDQVVDPVSKATLRQEGGEITHQLLSYAKEKLKNPGIENEKLLAEVQQLLSAKERDTAEARKLNAESEQIEFNNAVRRLRLSLKASRVFLLRDPDQEAILFVSEVDELLKILDEFSNTDNS
jgi:hypothetical protein